MLRVALVVWLVGCALGCQRSSSQRHCRLGDEHTLALRPAKDFDAIALVATAPGAVALWSEPSGLHALRLDPLGVPQGASVRLGPRCDGGLDATGRDGGLDIACLMRPTRGKHDEPGGVAWLAVSRQLNVTARGFIGEAGPLSEGVALLRTKAGLELAWHDGAADLQRVWWAAPGRAGGEPLQLSERGRIAAGPSLALGPDGRAIASWAETWITGEKLHSRLVAWTRARGVRTLHEVGSDPSRRRAGPGLYAAMPKLIALGGRVVLAFRDHREGEKTGLYVAKLADLRLASQPVRVGRADGTGRPALAPCMGGLVSATPRTYGGDYFIGINWLDERLVRSRGEQQFYEDSHAFTQVAAACQGTHALLFIAEFPQLSRETAALRAVSYHCP